MTTGELLDEMRAYYLDRFSEVVAAKHDDGAFVTTEAAFRDQLGEPVCEGPFNLPARTDVVVIVGGQVTESINVDTSGMLSFQPISLAWEGMTVTLKPFQWNMCIISTAGQFTPETATTPFVEWFHRWFKAEEDGSPGELLGAVHFMSDPEVTQSQVNLSADLDLTQRWSRLRPSVC